MKKLFLFVVLSVAGLCQSLAATDDNCVYAGNVSIEAGETVEVPVYMNNADLVCAIQFDLTLPEGVSVNYTINSRTGKKVWGVKLGTERFEELDHTLSIQEQSEQVYRFVISSNTNQSVWDSSVDGDDIRTTSPIVTLTLKASEDASGTMSFSTSNVTFAKYDEVTTKTTKTVGQGKASQLTVTGGIVTCAAPVISYVNGKLSCTCETPGAKVFYSVSYASSDVPDTQIEGEVVLSSVATVTAYATAEGYADSPVVTKTITLSNSEASSQLQGDMNNDGQLTIDDVTILVNIILGLIGR